MSLLFSPLVMLVWGVVIPCYPIVVIVNQKHMSKEHFSNCCDEEKKVLDLLEGKESQNTCSTSIAHQLTCFLYLISACKCTGYWKFSHFMQLLQGQCHWYGVPKLIQKRTALLLFMLLNRIDTGIEIMILEVEFQGIQFLTNTELNSTAE